MHKNFLGFQYSGPQWAIFQKYKKKKWRGVCIPRGDITFSKKLPRVSDGCGILMWRVISSAHNLGSHSNSEKKNFTQH
jgi:hypothetical protein